jgi:hypothetical protein
VVSGRAPCYLIIADTEVVPARLDYQHRCFVALCHERLLHPSIPTEDVETVADVATGTGDVT